MTLEQFEKDDLKSLTEHRGFKVLEKLAEKMEYDLLKKFKTVNLANEWVWQDLVNTQNMLAWAEYLIKTAKASSQTIVKKK